MMEVEEAEMKMLVEEEMEKEVEEEKGGDASERDVRRGGAKRRLGGTEQDAKHDDDGVPAPMKPKLKRFVLITDTVLFAAAASAYAGLAPAAAWVFAAGCMIGAVEGAPQWLKAVKGLVGA